MRKDEHREQARAREREREKERKREREKERKRREREAHLEEAALGGEIRVALAVWRLAELCAWAADAARDVKHRWSRRRRRSAGPRRWPNAVQASGIENQIVVEVDSRRPWRGPGSWAPSRRGPRSGPTCGLQ